jgi:hypothetical protein
MNSLCLRVVLLVALILLPGFAYAQTAGRSQGGQSDRWSSRQILQLLKRILEKQDALSIKLVKVKDDRSGEINSYYFIRDKERGEDYMMNLDRVGGSLYYTVLYVSGNKKVCVSGSETNVTPIVIYVTRNDRMVCLTNKVNDAHCHKEYLAAMDNLARFFKDK